MARYQAFSAIAAVLIVGISPSANAQPGRYNRYNNPGDRIGTPGFSRPIFMPSRRNEYPGDRYSRFDIQVVQQNPLFIGISAYLAVPG